MDCCTTCWSPPCDELLSYPQSLTSPTTVDSEMPEEESTAKKEVLWCIHNRWSFDVDDGPSIGPDGPDEKDRVLMDEFHPKYVLLDHQYLSLLTALLIYLLKGMSLYQEMFHQRLTTNPTIYTLSSDGCLFGFLPYRTGIVSTFYHDAMIVGPPCLTDTFSDHLSAATPTTAGSATAATERSWNATDNWYTNLNAAVVEEAAFSTFA